MPDGTLPGGQWIGNLRGSNNLYTVVDLDDCDDHVEGHAYAFDMDGNLPSTMVEIRTANRSPTQVLQGCVATPLAPRSFDRMTRDQLAAHMPSVTFPTTVDVNLQLQKGMLNVSWKSNIGTSGDGEFRPSRADQPSEYRTEKHVQSWPAFRKYALEKVRRGGVIFRGQGHPLRLRTSFHRTRRKDLFRFMLEDTVVLRAALSAQTAHVFNLVDNFENAAFLSLVRHHHYPTPLLDWTYSPFVAVFFAFSSRRAEGGSPDDPVRIFEFDKENWTRDYNRPSKYAVIPPYISMLEPLAVENERLTPQQSLFTVTNVDDVEAYIRFREQEQRRTNKRPDDFHYLHVFDLPSSEGPEALRQLDLMGVNAGSLFPGLDGTCEALKARLFGY